MVFPTLKCMGACMQVQYENMRVSVYPNMYTSVLRVMMHEKLTIKSPCFRQLKFTTNNFESTDVEAQTRQFATEWNTCVCVDSLERKR